MRKSRRSTTDKEMVSQIVTVETDDTTCSVCYAEFLDSEDLEVHIQQVHPPGKLINCQFCEEILPNAEVYVLHVRDVHLTDLRSCQYCYRVFIDINVFKKHQIKHTRAMPKNIFSCSQCNLHSSSILELSQHEFSEHPFGEGVFLNKYYALLSSVINIKADNVIQAIGKDFIYVCSQCKHSDADLGGYISHLKVKNCRTLVCDQCYKVFAKKRTLIEHYTRNRKCNNIKKEPPKKQCKECQKFFAHKIFKQHVKSCKAIKCSNCKKKFDTMYELSEHQSKEHPLAVSLVVCTFCRKECVGKIALDKHVDRVHSHELHLYKYTCSYCQTTFKHPQRLFAHYFMKHKDIEPYNCNICDKKFRIRKQFTLHIKLVHSSNGFVEFDEKLHVFFTDKKSEKPFQPVSKYTVEKTSGQSKSKDRDKSVENDKDTDLQLVNVNSDFMNPTETEGNQTDANQDSVVQRKRRRKTKPSVKKSDIDEMAKLTDEGDSEDEPLVAIKKIAKIKSQLRKSDLRWNKTHVKPANMKERFTCKICKQYCYTFQNYHNHVSMHFKDESKKCVKCLLSFKSKANLQRHLVEEHSSSKLTETLKNLLERRKKGEQKEELSMTKKFLKTIKKVKCDKDDVTATLTPITKELSVQNFIENFTPEVNENKGIQINDNITLTKVMAPQREPLIKMTKFKPAPVINEANIKLAMPVRFKKHIEKHSVTIRKVEAQEFESEMKLHYDEEVDQFQDDYDNEYTSQENNREAYIPEVEREVTLEGTDEAPKRKTATHKIVIPKLPKELKSIRIAHLLPEAPYYKIVKMDDIIHTPAKKVKEAPIVKKNTPVQLPDGTKLVHVNPLAHLLGNTPVEKLIQPNSKYYKPKNRNFEDALAKAMQKLENPKKQSRKKVEKAPSKDEAAKIQERDQNKVDVDNTNSGKLPDLEIEVNNEPTNQIVIEVEGNGPIDTEAEAAEESELK